MPAPVDVNDLLAQLATLTTMSEGEWRDFLACTPDQQMVIAAGYQDQDWAKEPDRLEAVLKVLQIIGTIAGVVSGVAGAGLAIAALRAL